MLFSLSEYFIIFYFQRKATPKSTIGKDARPSNDLSLALSSDKENVVSGIASSNDMLPSLSTTPLPTTLQPKLSSMESWAIEQSERELNPIEVLQKKFLKQVQQSTQQKKVPLQENITEKINDISSTPLSNTPGKG